MSIGHLLPDLDGVVAQSRDNLLRVVLQTVDALGGVAMALDARQLKTTRLPVPVDSLKRGSEEKTSDQSEAS